MWGIIRRKARRTTIIQHRYGSVKKGGVDLDFCHGGGNKVIAWLSVQQGKKALIYSVIEDKSIWVSK